jgi:Flp pilus assembly protein TadD
MRVNLANALFQTGRFAEAGNEYQFLLEKEPNNTVLINNYAVTLYRQGNKDEAVRQFRRALEINPTLKDAREGLAVALGEQPAGPPPERPLQAERPLQPQQSPTMPAQSTLGPPPFSTPTPTGKAFDPLGIQGK